MKNLLVVDQDLAVCNALKKELSAFNYNVKATNKIADVLTIAEKNLPMLF